MSGSLVLVADDDRDILELVRVRLERDGHRVVTAQNGEDALRTAVEERPQLAILDVMMPKMNGYDLTAALRRNTATRSIPVILLTARVEEADVDRGVRAGADDYVKKPFSTTELRDRVDVLLRRSE